MVFWNLLAGIRGYLTDGFLRGSAVIQRRCVCACVKGRGQPGTELMIRPRICTELWKL